MKNIQAPQVVVDTVVRFSYNRTSDSYKRRTVLVQSAGPTSFTGWDFGRKEVRQFSYHEVANDRVQELEASDGLRILDVTQLPSTVGYSQIEQAYIKQGLTVSYAGDILYALPQDVVGTINLPVNAWVTIETQNGTLTLKKVNSVTSLTTPKGVCSSVTPEVLLKELQRYV